MAALTCQECGRAAEPRARGWRAYIAADPRDAEPPTVGYYCPSCAEREFGAKAAGEPGSRA